MESDDDSFKKTIEATLDNDDNDDEPEESICEGRAIQKLHRDKRCYAFACKNFTPLDNKEINRIIQDLLTKAPRIAPTIHADQFLASVVGKVKFFEAVDTHSSLSKASFGSALFRDITGDWESVRSKVKLLFKNRRPKVSQRPTQAELQKPIRLATNTMEKTTMQRPTHAEFQKRIRLASDVTDFDILFSQMEFMIERVNQAQLAYGKSRWEWCVHWAIARLHQEVWADMYEMDRKTVLLLLEYLFRRYQPDTDDPEGFQTLTAIDVTKEFGTDKIDRILNIFLPMDKANAFFKMAPRGNPQPPPGLSWYSKIHTDQDLQARHVQPNANGKGPMNRRYIQLMWLANDYLDEQKEPHIGEHWKQWTEPDMPPPWPERLERIQEGQAKKKASSESGAVTDSVWVHSLAAKA